MLKSLPKSVFIKQEKRNTPSKETINSILNYSKSIELVEVKSRKILIHLN